MNKNLIFGIGALSIVGAIVLVSTQGGKKPGTTQKEIIVRQNVTPPTVTIKNDSTVPLPQEIDIIRLFVNLIDEGRPSDAVGMMGPKVLNDDSNKQSWAVMFNAFESMKVIKLEPSMQSDWTENIHTYKATLDVKIKLEAASVMPMPNYGFDNGENIRWITLEKVDNKWTVQGFATGP